MNYSSESGNLTELRKFSNSITRDRPGTDIHWSYKVLFLIIFEKKKKLIHKFINLLESRKSYCILWSNSRINY